MKNATQLSCAGNRFILLDCRDGDWPEDLSELAKALCQSDSEREPRRRNDGLILALPPELIGSVKMVIFNADGTRPEICGNGIMCLAHWFWHQGDQESNTVSIETDIGLREVQVDAVTDGVHVNMGRVWVAEKTETVHVLGRDLNLTLTDVGNPHGIVFVDDLVDTPIHELGAALQVHPRFPAGLNVEFVSVEANEAHVRVFERGVGETEGCGTGACAVASVLRARAARAWPIPVRTSGGVLEVRGDDKGGVWLTGKVQESELDETSRSILAQPMAAAGKA